uniref:Uncharacterized protein n=1 Tax=Setaria viridis TaxID=4556 RepID=A0A4U6WD74_SETVI|nr:hypothetical protein SEVIR_1G151000v2 [Setaria viridis]
MGVWEEMAGVVACDDDGGARGGGLHVAEQVRWQSLEEAWIDRAGELRRLLRTGENPGAVGLCLGGEHVVLLQRQPLVHRVRERGRHYHHRPGCCQRADDAAAHHLPLPAGKVDGEPCGFGWRGRGEEGAGEGENLKPAVEGDDRALGGWLPQGDVGHGARATEHADPTLAAARERRDALRDVAAAGNLHDVRPERVGAVPRDDDRWLRLVLGPRRPAPRAARGGLSALWPTTRWRNQRQLITSAATATSVAIGAAVLVILVVALGAAAAEHPRRAAALVVLGLELQLVVMLLLLEMVMEVAGVERRRKMVTVYGCRDRIHRRELARDDETYEMEQWQRKQREE